MRQPAEVEELNEPPNTGPVTVEERHGPPNARSAAEGTTAPVARGPEPVRQDLEEFDRAEEPSRHRVLERLFRRRYFPGVKESQWNDWRWQLQARITNVAGLSAILPLSSDERRAFGESTTRVPFAITPYFCSLLAQQDPHGILRKMVLPSVQELQISPEEDEDPLNEQSQSPVDRVVHRYPDRVLFLVQQECATYCRYCTRSRLVGRSKTFRSCLQEGLAYIRSTPAIRDVLLSGGDPLLCEDAHLEYLLSSLRAIRHIEIIRIGTKVPVVLPQRITTSLVRMLKKYHPLYMSIHCSHPLEITEGMAVACSRCADAGIPLGSQTVLLAGINDSIETMRKLMHALLRVRVRPYYLYQCDPIRGSSHFRTPVDRGIEIIGALRGFTSGYAVPQFVIDAPGGGGKIPVGPDYVAGREGRDLLLRTYTGARCRHRDPVPTKKE